MLNKPGVTELGSNYFYFFTEKFTNIVIRNLNLV